jgi:hypothetical protein
MTENKKNEKAAAFEAGAQEESTNIVAELLQFLSHNKKWWLLPILIVLALVGVLVVLGGSIAAPFIYTLF